MASTMNRGGFADLTTPLISEIMHNEFELQPREYVPFLNMLTMDGEFVDVSYVTGLGNMAEKAEGEDVAYGEMLQGLDVRFTAVTYALAARVTMELKQDDRHNIFIEEIAAEIGRSAVETENILAADLWNSGFDATVRTGADGLEFFSTVHLYADASTYRNELATVSDMTAATIWQMIQDMEETVDDNGKILARANRPVRIIFPAELERTVGEIMKSTLLAYTGDNTTNVLTERGIKLDRWNYLTDADAWGMQAAKHSARWYWRLMLEPDAADDFDSKDSKISGVMRLTRGWVKPIGNFFTPGA